MTMDRTVIDASGLVAGRLASLAAKEALKGRAVDIVNAEKAVLSGNPEYNIRFYREKVVRGDPYHGPHYPKRPDMMLKRMIRGMLPYKKPAGRLAFSRIKVYLAVPEALQKERPRTLEQAGGSRPRGKHISMEALSGKI
jgi:large subunit ribosomal protein L13